MDISLSEAFDLFEAGDQKRAEAICVELISKNDREAGAHYLLGTILSDRGELAKAIKHLEIAAEHEKNPKSPALFNLAITYMHAREFEKASAAAKLYHAKIGGSAQAILLQAEIAFNANDPLLALQLSQSIEVPNPNFSQAKLLAAKALERLGNVSEAIQQLSSITEDINFGYDATCHLGFLFLSEERLDEAHAAFQKALRKNNTPAAALSGLGLVFLNRGNIVEGLNKTSQAAVLEPANARVLTNHAIALLRAEKTVEAETVCNASILVDSSNSNTYMLKSSILYQKLDFIGAINAASRAVVCSPDNHDAYYKRGILELLLGQFNTGWQGYEHRLDASWTLQQSLKYQARFVKDALRFPTREMLRGKRILLIEEQGVGDTIMFASMLDETRVLASGLEVIVDARLVNLMKHSFKDIVFHPPTYLERYSLSSFDHVLFFGSLGHALRRNQTDFHGRKYIQSKPNTFGKWKKYLSAYPGLKVGLSWRGGTANTNSNGRELSLTSLAPLLQKPNLTFVVLQHGAREEEIKLINEITAGRICVPAAEDIEDIQNLVGLIEALDEVVTAQNTNVHICGALSRSCHAIMPIVPTWSYGAYGSSMNWYKSVTLHRRKQGESLTDLIAGISQRLH